MIVPQLDAPVAIASGFERGIPASLLLVESAHEHIDLVMIRSFGSFGFTLSDRVRTLMDLGHGLEQDWFSCKNSMSCQSLQMRIWGESDKLVSIEHTAHPSPCAALPKDPALPALWFTECASPQRRLASKCDCPTGRHACYEASHVAPSPKIGLLR